jgi:hypothetical protein
MHVSIQLSLRAGLPPRRTVGEPGAHGATVLGIQGIGVNTPKAAAVAAATCGLDKLVHMAKGIIFIIGTLSIIVAAGVGLSTWQAGITIILDGAVPNEHLSMAPFTTSNPIFSSYYLCIIT